jgi:hypothetical protein
VEVLIASFLLLFMILGTIPLFTASMTNNLAGKESSEVSNFARSRAEELYQLPFSSKPLEILAGTERRYLEVYRQDAWSAVASLQPPLPAGTEWTRETTIRQYSIGDLTDPLPAGSDPGQVHLKEIEVIVRGVRPGGVLGVGKRIGVRMFKSQ